MRVPVLVALLVLAGCAGKVRQVEVVVPCRAPQVERPAVWEFDAIAPDADLFAQVRALLVEREQRAVYELLMEAALDACR